jgi:hypothetical protein
LLASTTGFAASTLISPITNLAMNWARLHNAVANLSGITFSGLTTMLFLNFEAASAFLHAITASLRAISPGIPFIPFCMNWAMD